MKIKLVQVLTLIYIIFISIITKRIHFIPIALLAALVLFEEFAIKNRTEHQKINLLYLLIALSTFPHLLALFLIYLPFAVFGLLLTNKSFIRSYILGFGVSLIPTIVIYIAANYLNLQLNIYIISSIFYLPILFASILIYKRKKGLEFINFTLNEYIIFLAVLLATAFVAINIVNNHSLFISNGTYYYSKFKLIVDNINSYKKFPIYDPSISMGESPFLFETPLMFSHIAFANIILPFIPSVLFYNTYSFFILFISILSLSILIKSVISPIASENLNKFFSITVIILGSSIIGLHFYFVQFLESFKAFFAFPINYLIFSLILEKPQNPKSIFIIVYLIFLSFIIHAAHGIGIVLISLSLFFFILIEHYNKDRLVNAKLYLINNKLKVLGVIFLLTSFVLFYIMPTIIFKDFLEETSKFNLKRAPVVTRDYLKTFFTDGQQLSLKYPDVRKNDDKRFGTFISITGSLSLIAIFILYKLKGLSNARLFAGGWIAHFLVSSMIVNLPLVGKMEYWYRTATPYFLIVLVVSLCAIIASIKQKHIKFFLILVFFVGLIHMISLAKKNIENIHQEKIIAGESFSNEIEFIKRLPNDGRIITYGLFSNAVDPAMASLTGKYFSRNLLTTNPRSRSIYQKIHDTEAWGASENLFAMSGTELSNYLIMGGYKYLFLNSCHPIGSFVISLIYSNFSYPIYQNNCMVLLAVNNTNYVEKVDLVENITDTTYKEKTGYKYITISRYYDFKRKNINFKENPRDPQGLKFERSLPTKVIIFGDFDNNDWVVFKEDYYSRWKAHMKDIEIPVLANNNNLILINTIKGESIILEYKVLPIEIFFGIISLIAVLIILFIFLISL